VDTFRLFGQEFAYSPLDIILPVGISFYTFQTMSYVIDIYFRKFAPTGKLINFCAFVSFFPQLVAGPIERAKNLLPQFDTLKTFNYEDTRSGLLTILFGLFKKIVVADRIAVYIDSVYGDIAAASGISLFWAVLFFTFQLYFDFSAYSDIAIGTAHILGFRLSVNFRRPYLSASYQDLWTRWHISLTSWFRDYVYIPLGGNRKGAWRTVRNVLIVFLLSGLWHGASWNFVIWGFVNALFMLVLDLFLGAKKGGRFRRLFCPVLITACWALSLVFFRAKGLAAAVDVFRNIGFGAKEALYNFGLNASEFAFSLYLLAGLIIYEIVMEKYGDSLSKWFYSHFLIRWFVYLLLIFSVTFLGVYGPGNDNAFIYFQF
jgi:D-alanyl-lipoteichoic acid acyltransferase DltB (MBOAT superfamily)